MNMPIINFDEHFAEFLSDWMKKAQNADGSREGNPFQMQEEIRQLRRENARLKEENEILLKASAFFATKTM